MSTSSKVTQALNSAEKAHNAVGQAIDHTSDRMIEQADNALVHAEQAVSQAIENGGGQQVAEAFNQVAEDRETLGGH